MMRRLSRLRLAAAGVAALLLGGCTEEVTYSYFEVNVAVDRASVDMETLAKVAYCAMYVKDPAGSTIAMSNLPCQRGTVAFEYGKVGWSTKRTSGQVVFSVLMQDFNFITLAQGESGAITVVPNQTTPAALLVKSVAPAQPDGGVRDAGRDDAATDAATDGGIRDATAADGPAVDAGADASAD